MQIILIVSIARKLNDANSDLRYQTYLLQVGIYTKKDIWNLTSKEGEQSRKQYSNIWLS